MEVHRPQDLTDGDGDGGFFWACVCVCGGSGVYLFEWCGVTVECGQFIRIRGRGDSNMSAGWFSFSRMTRLSAANKPVLCWMSGASQIFFLGHKKSLYLWATLEFSLRDQLGGILSYLIRRREEKPSTLKWEVQTTSPFYKKFPPLPPLSIKLICTPTVAKTDCQVV